MTNKIKMAFDYHKFSPNARLAAMIAETERLYSPLSDDQLFLVTAAGEPVNTADPFDENKKGESEK